MSKATIVIVAVAIVQSGIASQYAPGMMEGK